jgi:hypothetical protein
MELYRQARSKSACVLVQSSITPQQHIIGSSINSSKWTNATLRSHITVFLHIPLEQTQKEVT